MIIQPSTSIPCKSTEDFLPHPRTCCKVPHFITPKKIVLYCQSENEESKDICSTQRCIARESGVLVDGKMQKNKLLEYFERGIDNLEGDELKKSWMQVVNSTVEECVEKCELNKIEVNSCIGFDLKIRQLDQKINALSKT